MDDSDAYTMAESVLLKMRPNMSAVDRKTSLVKLGRYSKALRAEKEDLEAELEREYDKLTPERADKYPEIFEKKWAKFRETEQQYMRVSEILNEIALRERGGDLDEVVEAEERRAAGLSGASVNRGAGESAEVSDLSAGGHSPDEPAEQRSLFAVHG